VTPENPRFSPNTHKHQLHIIYIYKLITWNAEGMGLNRGELAAWGPGNSEPMDFPEGFFSPGPEAAELRGDPP
jgi:hypothetical protein